VLQLNGSWLHVSAPLRPSSSQLVQIKCPQCAYNMGSVQVGLKMAAMRPKHVAKDH